MGNLQENETPLWEINKETRVLTPLDFKDIKYSNQQIGEYVYDGLTRGKNSDSGSNTNFSTVIWFYQKNTKNGDPMYFYEFTNFFNSPVVIDEIRWPTTEHYFQYMKIRSFKTHDSYYDLNEILSSKESNHAFEIGQQKINVLKEWHTMGKKCMYKALFHKFTQSPYLYNLLAATNGMVLVEHAVKGQERKDHNWGDYGIDNWWGIVKGDKDNKFLVDSKDDKTNKSIKIHNWLGKLLMFLRWNMIKQNFKTFSDIPLIKIPSKEELQKYPKIKDAIKTTIAASAPGHVPMSAHSAKTSSAKTALASATGKKSSLKKPSSAFSSQSAMPSDALTYAHSARESSDKDYMKCYDHILDWLINKGNIIVSDIKNNNCKKNHWGWYIWPHDKEPQNAKDVILNVNTAVKLLKEDENGNKLWKYYIKHITEWFKLNTYCNFFDIDQHDLDVARVFRFSRFWFDDVYRYGKTDITVVYDFINAIFKNYYIRKWYFEKDIRDEKLENPYSGEIKNGYDAFKKYAEAEGKRNYANLCDRNDRYVIVDENSMQIVQHIFDHSKSIKNNKIGVIVAGNAGRTMGNINSDKKMCELNQKWNGKHDTQEGCVTKEWLKHEILKTYPDLTSPNDVNSSFNDYLNVAKNAFKEATCRKMGPKWGLKNMNDTSTDTYQKVDYTKRLNAKVAKEYKRAFEKKNAPLAFKFNESNDEKDFLDVVLAYTFGPNVSANGSTDFSATRRTKIQDYDFNTDFLHLRSAVKYAIEACFDLFVENGVQVPIVCKVSGEKYTGNNTTTQKILDAEYELIVQELLGEKEEYALFSRIYFSVADYIPNNHKKFDQSVEPEIIYNLSVDLKDNKSFPLPSKHSLVEKCIPIKIDGLLSESNKSSSKSNERKSNTKEENASKKLRASLMFNTKINKENSLIIYQPSIDKVNFEKSTIKVFTSNNEILIFKHDKDVKDLKIHEESTVEAHVAFFEMDPKSVKGGRWNKPSGGRNEKWGGAGDKAPNPDFYMIILNYQKIKNVINSDSIDGKKMREKLSDDIDSKISVIMGNPDFSDKVVAVKFSNHINIALQKDNVLGRLTQKYGGDLLLMEPNDDQEREKIIKYIIEIEDDDEILENTLDEYTELKMKKYERMEKGKNNKDGNEKIIANRVKELKIRDEVLGGFKFGTYTFTAAVSAFSGIMFALLFNPII